MQHKYFDLNQSWSQIHIFFLYLESLDVGTLDKKWLKDKDIKKPTEETKDEKKITSHHLLAPARDDRVSHESLNEKA